MQPCSREMQAMNSVLNVIGSTTQQIPLHDDNNVHQLIHNPHFDPSNPSPSSSSHHDFLQHMLLSNSWSDSDIIASNSDETCPPNSDDNNGNVGFSYDELLPSKLRVDHQINSGGGGLISAMPGGEGSMMQGLFNGFGGGSLHGIETNNSTSMNQTSMQFNQQEGNMGATGTTAGTAMNRGQAGGSTPAQPKTRVRARRGQATDPHSIAERLRRERIAERMKALQELVPNANRTDKASMLDEIIDYLKFLQLQVKVLSVSRLGGAGATVAPFVANMPSQRGGGGDGVQTNADGGSSNGKQTPSTNDGKTVTEHQVLKLMEEDMGSAMQYLQGKGLCLMPISLAAAISTSTCHSRNPHTVNGNNNNNHPLLQSSGEGPSSPSMSVLTVQSASNGVG